MAKEICISSTPHETRLAILEDDLLTEIYYERENEYTLAGSIYKGRVTRVLPGMQSAFVDLGLERDAFLYVTDFMEEQEDSADFEKVPSSNGNGHSRREAQPTPEPHGGRESRDRNREPRVPRGTIILESETEVGPGSSAFGLPPSSVASSEEESGPGTRRWRGRRGRRRGGRPQEPREATSVSHSAQPSHEVESHQADADFSIEVESGPVVYEEAASHGGGQASYSGSIVPSEIPQPRALAATPAIVLPGESLSRYGGKPAESPARPHERGTTASVSSVSSYKPSTLVEVVPGWDGGAELPGESLSRYRGKVTPKPPAASEIVEHAWEVPATNAQPATEEQLPQPAGVLVENHPMVEAEAEAHVSPEDSLPVEHVEVASEQASVPEHQREVVEANSPIAEAEPEPETHFEPENASASYRIDPVPPSEYRFSPVIEDQPETVATWEEPPFERQEAPATVDSTPIQSTPEETISTGYQPTQELTLVGHVDAPEEISPVVYEEEVLPPSSANPASTQDADPLLESRRESQPEARVEVPNAALSTIEESPLAETGFLDDDDDFADGPRSFSPGSGTLEEEIIDEEEYDSGPIRAYSDEVDLDDLEEETLDNLSGAELSEMVRDAHLEQRIGVSPDGVTEEEDSEVEFGQRESDLDDDEDEEDAANNQAAVSSPAPARRDGRTDEGRHGQRGGRRRGRPNGGGGGSRRANSQLSDLPIISELLKQGQEILVQIAKEPIAKKGARITSHIALPGRFLVFMPTVNHVGVSRKISSDEERQRLKRILISEKGGASGGFIVRTAADGASEDDLRADIRFLISLWNDIKQRADDGKAPALIYHDLNLIERVLRDQVSANFSTIWVDNEAEYERIVRFLNRFEPSLVRRVKLYTKETPLFEQFGIQEEIGKALKSKVWLKSGGSIVINQTEALVAIDINTGKYVGKTARLEDTILRTNLDAIPEIVRQMRLRDLGGIIVIDFIDMDDRRNRHKVMAALEEELKSDRAPSKVLQFNDFGLVAITRKRVKQSLERTLSVQCEVCAGTGMVKSPTTVCNEIYTELRKMQKHLERGDVLLRVNPEVVKTLKANNAKWLNELEEMTGKTIIVKSDPALHPEQFDIQ
jgi:ribonuclease E